MKVGDRGGGRGVLSVIAARAPVVKRHASGRGWQGASEELEGLGPTRSTGFSYSQA